MRFKFTLSVGMPGILLLVLTGDIPFALMPALAAFADMLTGDNREV